MLTSSEKDRDTIYMKKLDNGVAIKEINTNTGEEVVFLLTIDSTLHSDQNKAPISSTISQEPELKKLTSSSKGDNRPKDGVLSQKLFLKPDITNSNLFQEKKATKNAQKTNTIFVKNTKLAKEQGLHISIPKKVKYINITDNNKNKTLVETNSSFSKPFQIIAGDYMFYLNIDFPPLSEKKTIYSQTQNSLTNLFEKETRKVCNIRSESVFQKRLCFKYQNEATQTEENDGSVTDSTQPQVPKSCATQTDNIKTLNFGTSTSGLQVINETNLKTFSFEALDHELDHFQREGTFVNNKCTNTVSPQNSESSLKTFASHAQFQNTNTNVEHFLDHNQFQNSFSHIQLTSDNTLPERSAFESSSGRKITDVEQVSSDIKVFDNSSNFLYRAPSSHDYRIFAEESNLNLSIDSDSTKSVNINKNTIGEVNNMDFYQINGRHTDSNNSIKINDSISSGNVTIKEIKQRLNKATFSLTQLYSAVELMENLSFKSYSQDSTGDISTTSVNILENDFTQSMTAVNSLKDTETSGHLLCDRCGLFFMTKSLVYQGHDCDHYCAYSVVNVQNTDLKCITEFQERSGQVQKNKNENTKIITGEKQVQNICYPAECLSKSAQDRKSEQYIKNSYAQNSNHRNENKNRFNSVVRDCTESKTSSKSSTTESFNGSIPNEFEKNNTTEVNRTNKTFSSVTEDNLAMQNEFNFYNNIRKTPYEYSSEEIINVISLKKVGTKAFETSLLVDSLNSQTSNKQKLAMSTNFQTQSTYDVHNIPPYHKSKLVCLYGKRQGKSSVGFRNNKSLERKSAYSAPNTQLFSVNTPCDQDKNHLLADEKRSSSDISTVLKNKSQCLSTKSTSFSTLDIIPSSYEVVQGPEYNEHSLKRKKNFVVKSIQNLAFSKLKLKERSETSNKNLKKISNSSVNSKSNNKNVAFSSAENWKNNEAKSSIDLTCIFKNEKQVSSKDFKGNLNCNIKKPVLETKSVEKIKCTKKKNKRRIFCFTL